MLEFDPLDEYPIHQVPLPMRYVGPSDRNFYDRCIYQGVDHEGDAFFITGLGVYPNLGVIDAFATVRRGDRQWAVRAVRDPVPTTSCSRRSGRTASKSSSRTTRSASCATPTSTASASTCGTRPSTARSPSPRTSGAWATASCSTRRASPASARGRASCASTARRSRSRPNASPRRATGPGASGRWARPNRRAGRASSTACGGTGSRCASTTSCCTSSSKRIRAASRNTNFAVRCWPASTGKAPEQLGWPLPEITYKSGTRWPTRAAMELVGPRRQDAHARDRADRRHPAQRRLRIRRRPGLDARRLEGRRLGRRFRLRLQRSGRVRPGRVLDRRPHRARHVRRSGRLGHLRARQHRQARTVGLHRHDAGRALTRVRTRPRAGVSCIASATSA